MLCKKRCLNVSGSIMIRILSGLSTNEHQHMVACIKHPKDKFTSMILKIVTIKRISVIDRLAENKHSINSMERLLMAKFELYGMIFFMNEISHSKQSISVLMVVVWYFLHQYFCSIFVEHSKSKQ